LQDYILQIPIATKKNLNAKAANGEASALMGLIVINALDQSSIKIIGKDLVKRIYT
jgi:hypothetical protein